VVHLEPIRRWASGPILVLAALEEPCFQVLAAGFFDHRSAALGDDDLAC
jgi:hypothetical protein